MFYKRNKLEEKPQQNLCGLPSWGCYVWSLGTLHLPHCDPSWCHEWPQSIRESYQAIIYWPTTGGPAWRLTWRHSCPYCCVHWVPRFVPSPLSSLGWPANRRRLDWADTELNTEQVSTETEQATDPPTQAPGLMFMILSSPSSGLAGWCLNIIRSSVSFQVLQSVCWG